MFFPYAKLKTEEISGFCGKLTVFENKNNTTNAVVGGSEVELTVTIPKIFAPRSVNLYLYDENCIETRSICVGECIGWQNEYDEYLFSFSSPNPGLYFYKILKSR